MSEPCLPVQFPPLPVAVPWLTKFLAPPRLQALYAGVRGRAGSGPPYGELLESLGVRLEYDGQRLERIPARGPVVVVANHPFGLLEGPILGHLLSQVRRDVRFLANSLLAALPEFAEQVIPVNPFGGREAMRENLGALRRAHAWLREGGLLVVFPAGEVSSLQARRLRIEDPEWKPAAARLVLRAEATAVPLYFRGANSPGFQSAGLLHPALRTALLGREFVNKQGQVVRLEIGAPIGPTTLGGLATEEDVTDYLRRRVHALRWRPGQVAAAGLKRAAPIVAAGPARRMRAEIEALPGDRLLAEAGGVAVFHAAAQEIPATLGEIGRLRELTFRLAGEGTGQAADLDRFDAQYTHLFLWNAEREEIAGAYRLGETERLLGLGGIPALYTSTLFRFEPEFFRQMGPAIELGRSFVRPEYQRHFHPLLLLWKGIGRYIVERPRCRRLFGPVSVSASYSRISRELMAAFLATRCRESALATMVRPRRPFRPRIHVAADVRRMAAVLPGFDDLCTLIEDLEPARRPIPVLLRQYLALGGQFLAFNVDPRFAGVLDGLVLVDLLATDGRTLKRHLGAEGARRFLDFHT